MAKLDDKNKNYDTIEDMAEATKDKPLLTEEQKKYIESLHAYDDAKYMENLTGRISCNSVKIRSLTKYLCKLFASVIVAVAIFIFGINLIARLPATYKIWEVAVGLLVLVLATASLAAISIYAARNINQIIIWNATNTKIKVGELYMYDPLCEKASTLVYSPVYLQVIGLCKDKETKELTATCIDIANNHVHKVTKLDLLVPVKTMDLSRESHVIIRFPAMLPRFEKSDVEALEAAFIIARDNRAHRLTDKLLDINGKINKMVTDDESIYTVLDAKFDQLKQITDHLIKVVENIPSDIFESEEKVTKLIDDLDDIKDALEELSK